jgi:phosphoribulokinase
VVVRFQPPNGVIDSAHLSVRMALRPVISHERLVEVAEEAAAAGCGAVTITLGRDDGSPVDILEVAAGISPEETAQVVSLLWKRMSFDHHLERDDIGLFVEGNRRRHSDPLAIAQLFVAYHLLNEAASEQ